MDFDSESKFLLELIELCPGILNMGLNRRQGLVNLTKGTGSELDWIIW
jgi:hypothetical protein